MVWEVQGGSQLGFIEFGYKFEIMGIQELKIHTSAESVHKLFGSDGKLKLEFAF
jgi:hypothetical protein